MMKVKFKVLLILALLIGTCSWVSLRCIKSGLLLHRLDRMESLSFLYPKRSFSVPPIRPALQIQDFSLRSSQKCLGDISKPKNTPRTSCVLRNVCYQKSQKTFLYFTDHSTPISPLQLSSIFGFKFVQTAAQPIENITLLDDTFVLRKSKHAFYSFAHRLWDASFGYFLGLHMLNEQITPDMHIVMRKPSAAYKVGLFEYLYSRHKLKVLPFFLRDTVGEYICFKKLIVVAGWDTSMYTFRDGIAGMRRPLDYLKPNLYVKFRRRVMDYYNVSDSNLSEHRIVIFEKTKSDHTKITMRRISNSEEIATFITKTYPQIPLTIIDPSKLTMKDQLEMLQKTSILITPPGGISTTLPFLPTNANVILIDYKASEDHRLFKINASVSMEADFWDSLSYLNKHYYQIFDESDFEWIHPENLTTDSRKWTNSVLKTERIQKLINRCLARTPLANVQVNPERMQPTRTTGYHF